MFFFSILIFLSPSSSLSPYLSGSSLPPVSREERRKKKTLLCSRQGRTKEEEGFSLVVHPHRELGCRHATSLVQQRPSSPPFSPPSSSPAKKRPVALAPPFTLTGTSLLPPSRNPFPLSRLRKSLSPSRIQLPSLLFLCSLSLSLSPKAAAAAYERAKITRFPKLWFHLSYLPLLNTPFLFYFSFKNLLIKITRYLFTVNSRKKKRRLIAVLRKFPVVFEIMEQGAFSLKFKLTFEAEFERDEVESER